MRRPGPAGLKPGRNVFMAPLLLVHSVLGRFNFHFGRRQRSGRLGRRRRRRGRGQIRPGRGLADLDAVVLVVEHDVRSAVADATAGLRLTVIRVNFQFGKVRLNFAVAGVSVDVKASLVGHAQVDVAVAAVDLNVAERTHGDFDAAVFILQADIAGDVLQPDLLGTRGQVEGTGDLVGVEVIGVKIEIAIDAREVQVGAGRLEGDVLADTGELDALLEFAFELRSTLDVGDGNFVEPAADVDVAGNLLDLGGTFFEIEFYVADDAFHRNFAAARDDMQLHLARDGDIEIALHSVVAGGLSSGVEDDRVPRHGDRGC